MRRRQRRQLWLEGALWGALGALALAAAAGFLALLSPGLGRLALLLSPVVGALVACAFGVVLSQRAVGDEARTARLVGARRNELRLDVLAAVELLRERDGRGQSRALAEAFLQQVDARVAPLSAGQLVDARRVRRAGAALGALVLLLVLVALLAGGRWRAGLARAFAAPGSPAAAALREPITGDVELTYRYPAYTGLEPRTVAGTTGEVSAPAGTEVQLRTRSDRAVGRAELVVNGQPLPLTVTGERDLAGSFVAQKPGAYHFVFSTAKGKLLATGPDIPIHVEADAPPQVTLLTPGAELEVDPGQQVALRYEASDDYGLTELWLVYRPPRASEDQRVRLSADDTRRTRGGHTWDLGALKLEPGDRVSYFIEAKDNDAVEGPKRGVSRTHVLKVYSAAEHRRAALEKAEALWSRLVDQLADRLESTDRERTKDMQAVTAGGAVDTRGMVLVDDLRSLGQELMRERDAPPELPQALVNIAESLSPHVRATMEARSLYVRYQRGRGEDWGTGGRLTQAVGREIAELEKDVLYLESLLDRQKLQELRELAERLASDRRELARLIEQFKQSPGEEARAEVMRQIEQLRARMEELARRMSELRQGIRDEHLNAEALSEMMEEQDMQGALEQVEQLMREGKADEALAKLQELSMQMDQMLQGLGEAQEQFGEEQYPELAEKFGRFMQDLEATTKEQQRVADDTRKLRDAGRERTRERLSQRGAQLKQELLREVEKAQAAYRELSPEELNGRVGRPLEEAQSQLESIAGALKVDDFDLAAEAAERATRAADQLAMLGEQQRELDQLFGNPPAQRQGSQAVAERLQQEQRRVHDIHEKLQGLFPPPGSQMSEGERRQSQELAEQQRGLQERARGLRQQMQEMEGMAPLFGQEAGEQMDGIGQRMGEAGQRMQARDPGRGYGEQQAALEGLRQFQQQMRDAQQQQRGQGRGSLPLPMGAGRGRQQGGNGRNSEEKVELPDEDAFQAPREFRKDLLDAMKQGAPEKYRDQVKRYYEELVK